ncbi:MAG: hypothetical protein ACM3UR_11265 [Bacteroidota bacterium]|jgi:rRNA-processing protein FCF1|nr:PIN domain-containing protein [Ignavibacteria bacterium]MCU7499187.1 PIN domain-containing protein [Ignavibacteria bacterium]MCU7513610.1 PIN domain-containing protein [Ignavibacteria bacterium]MCU7520136.1 PIN domain-containing protein [Ignavibacteria bacterium]MCU7525710.1 PIN domain-containing protein [Ignavibacteria bacterium]
MRIIVKDANIIFSLLDSELMDLCLKLDYEFWTSDFVINEIEDTGQKRKIGKYVKDKRINIYSYNGEEVAQIFELSENRSLSDADCSVFLLTQIKNGILLSSDRALRAFATRNGIEVKGMIWILDELVKNKIMDPSAAAEKLEFIAENSMWLPASEVESRINRWKGMSK